ncbi:hypothetical protein ACF061_22770 [Streptomyces sp. NPDC015220]|uniref:hypothetical protein n=1 Tax=Streptomyces sp. NPDC015220 TaxID=3364947 RepID=UPI0036FDAAF7
MTLDVALVAVPDWGEPRVLRHPGRNSAEASWTLDYVGVHALAEGGTRVAAIALWWLGCSAAVVSEPFGVPADGRHTEGQAVRLSRGGDTARRGEVPGRR